MSTWSEGRRTLNWEVARTQINERNFLQSILTKPPKVATGTAVYLATEADSIPRSMTQMTRFFGVLHERNILLTFVGTQTPRLAPEERVSVDTIAPGMFRVLVRYGFMEQPNVVTALRYASEAGLEYKPDETVYVAGRETATVTTKSGMPMWRKRLFSLMSRNSELAPIHYGVPIHKMVEIGSHTPL
jgi:KUP system potassium uptake protein